MMKNSVLELVGLKAAGEETQFGMGVMVVRELFPFGQCTPRSGSAYLLHVHSFMPDNTSLQAAVSCLCVCEVEMWGAWFLDVICQLICPAHSTPTFALIVG